MGGGDRHVVGDDRLGQALQCKRADLFGGDTSFQRDIDTLAEQDLAVRGLGTETSGDIANRTDCSVPGALGRPQLA